MIRMGSAMMEGGAKSGNFMGIMGLGLRSGQDEMTLRQAQQEKMRQAITEGSLKVATGRTTRDDAMARGATTLTATEMTNATHLEAARIQADAHLKAAAMHAAATGASSKNQIVQLANARANTDPAGARATTQEDIEWAAEVYKPPPMSHDSTQILAQGFAKNAGLVRPTDEMWKRAVELNRGQGAAASVQRAAAAWEQKERAALNTDLTLLQTFKDPVARKREIDRRVMEGLARHFPEQDEPVDVRRP
jgi:hypothetical protein